MKQTCIGATIVQRTSKIAMIAAQRRTSRSCRAIRVSLAGALLCVGCLAGCGSEKKAEAQNSAEATPALVVKVTRRSLSSTLEIASEFLPFQEIDVYAKVSGYIQKLYVDWGTHVHQGQLLAVLEIPELEQQIQSDQASVERASEELNRAKSAYTVAHLTYQRLHDVQKTQPELVAQQDIDVASGKDLETNAAVSAAKQGLLAAQSTLAKDKALYSYARITAPFDGVVTEIDAYTGALLPAGTSSNKGDQALCHIAEDRLLRLVIPVPESAVPAIRLGSSVQVRVPVLAKTFQGRVARIADRVDLSTRTMHTEIDVPNPKLEIVPGMYAEASLVLKEDRDVLAIPLQAVDRQQDRATVFVVDGNGRIQERQIQTGLETSDQVEVISGLHENDLVVVGNRTQLRPGATIQPKLIPSGLLTGGT